MNIEELRKLEKTGTYLFHGSADYTDSNLDPRQAYTNRHGRRVEDDKPAVHTTPVLDIAIFMATVNRKNAPENFHSNFSGDDKGIKLSFNKETSKQINDNSSGYVYVFNKSDFQQRNEIEYISYDEVKPINIVEVKFSDISIPADVFED